MKSLSSIQGNMLQHCFDFQADAHVVLHCHHFNLFLDQTIDDVFGAEAGFELRSLAATCAATHLLESACGELGAQTSAERIDVAKALFTSMGHGKLDISVGPEGGAASGYNLHYAFTWRDKYGDMVRRRHPADAFGGGFAAAAGAVSVGKPGNSFAVKETKCYALKDSHCEFEIKPVAEDCGAMLRVGRARVGAVAKGTVAPGLDAARIGVINQGLREFLATVAVDERGLIQGFGVFITRHLASYYNGISFGAVEHIKANRPAVLPVLEALLRESGHVCVFNTFGGIVLSPEWEGLVGPIHTAQPADIISFCTAIARALGFGYWTVQEFVPGERLVIRAPCTYESVYFVNTDYTADGPVGYFLQGAALAFMELAMRVQWDSEVELTRAFYQSLFSGGTPYAVEQTACIANGDDYDEVVVTRV